MNALRLPNVRRPLAGFIHDLIGPNRSESEGHSSHKAIRRRQFGKLRLCDFSCIGATWTFLPTGKSMNGDFGKLNVYVGDFYQDLSRRKFLQWSVERLLTIPENDFHSSRSLFREYFYLNIFMFFSEPTYYLRKEKYRAWVINWI